jgi:hypothetical protein
MSFFTVLDSFSGSFITFCLSLHEYLVFLCNTLMAKKIIQNLGGGFVNSPSQKNNFVTPGKRLPCVYYAATEVF